MCWFLTRRFSGSTLCLARQFYTTTCYSKTNSKCYAQTDFGINFRRRSTNPSDFYGFPADFGGGFGHWGKGEDERHLPIPPPFADYVFV